MFQFFVTPVFAQSNFTTDYNVTYNVLENALTHVTFDVTLTNKTSQYYASSYNLQVGFKDIKNVLASDSDEKISPVIKKNDNGSDIELIFNKKSVGLNEKLLFTISFDTKDIAQREGKVWNINIPGLKKQREYDSFDVSVIFPKSLGSPSYVKPDIGTLKENTIKFTKEDLQKSGISIAFGDEEIYDFELSYHLKNPNLFPIKTEIALPPNTNYQDVEISGISPKPSNVTKDIDGNWLAQYVLKPSHSQEVTAKGKVKILLHPLKKIASKEELSLYLKEKPFWQINNKEIKNLAKELKTPYEIYKYVVNNLTYDFERVQNNLPRRGALEVLKNPKSAVCLEFTDLFIAIARAAGIPAREVNGFAFTENSKERPLSLVKDVLHAWPEYYDTDINTWVMVDPTWENTTGGVDHFHTLDFNHFAFVIKGENSTYPIPAGGYKFSDNESSKDIKVDFSSSYNPTAQTLSFSEEFSENYFSSGTIRGNIFVKNIGNIISSPQILTVSSHFLKPSLQKIKVNEIPPYGYLTIPVSFENPPLLTNKSDTIRIAINENYISKNIQISPFTLNKWTIGGAILLASIFIGLSIIAYKSRNLSFFRQQR